MSQFISKREQAIMPVASSFTKIAILALGSAILYSGFQKLGAEITRSHTKAPTETKSQIAYKIK